MKACPVFPARAVLPTLKPSPGTSSAAPALRSPRDAGSLPTPPDTPGRALSPPSPVHVGPQVLGRVVVDHQLHGPHVDAARRGICADEAVG